FAADDDVHGQTCVILGATFASTRLRGSVVAASFSGSRRRSPAPPGRLADSEAAKTHLGSNPPLSPSGDPLLNLATIGAPLADREGARTRLRSRHRLSPSGDPLRHLATIRAALASVVIRSQAHAG